MGVFESKKFRVEQVFGRNPIHHPVDWQMVSDIIDEGWELVEIYSPDVRAFHKAFAFFKWPTKAAANAPPEPVALFAQIKELKDELKGAKMQIGRMKKQLEK